MAERMEKPRGERYVAETRGKLNAPCRQNPVELLFDICSVGRRGKRYISRVFCFIIVDAITALELTVRAAAVCRESNRTKNDRKNHPICRCFALLRLKGLPSAE